MSTTKNKAEPIGGRVVRTDIYGEAFEVTEPFQVLRTFGAAAPTVAALTSAGLPAPGSAHPVYGLLLVSGYELNEDPNGTRWIFNVTYSKGTVVTGAIPRRIIRIGYDYQESTRDLRQDTKTGIVLLNSAGDPFEQVPQVGVVSDCVSMECFDNLAPSVISAVNGTINSASVTIQGVTFNSHCGRIFIRGEWIPNGTYAYKRTYTIVGRKNLIATNISGSIQVDIGWDEGIVHSGFYSIESGTRTRCMEDDPNSTLTPKAKIPSARPCLLDENGARQPMSVGYPTAIYVQTVQGYPDASWSGLGL